MALFSEEVTLLVVDASPSQCSDRCVLVSVSVKLMGGFESPTVQLNVARSPSTKRVDGPILHSG